MSNPKDGFGPFADLDLILGQGSRMHSRMARPVPAQRKNVIYGFSKTVDAPGQAQIPFMLYENFKVKKIHATDWPTRTAEIDRDVVTFYATKIPTELTECVEVPAIHDRRDFYIVGEDKNPLTDVEMDVIAERLRVGYVAPHDTLLLFNALSEAYGNRKKAVKGRLGPAPGTISKITGILSGADNTFPYALQGVSTSTYQNWVDVDKPTVYAGVPITIMLEFSEPGTFSGAFWGPAF